MCTPERLRENCSCPHLMLDRLWWVWHRAGPPVVVVAAVAAGAAAGISYGVMAAFMAWAGVMVTAAVISRSGGLWLVRWYTPQPPRLQVEEHPAQDEQEDRVGGEQAHAQQEPQHPVPVPAPGWPVGGHERGRRRGDDGVSFGHVGNHS